MSPLTRAMMPAVFTDGHSMRSRVRAGILPGQPRGLNPRVTTGKLHGFACDLFTRDRSRRILAFPKASFPLRTVETAPSPPSQSIFVQCLQSLAAVSANS
jgi:hypothetical protein